MPKEIAFNAFAMNCIGHQSSGLWAHTRDRSRDYRKLSYWVEFAQHLERGKFDGLFLADVLGVYDVFGEGPEAALRHGAQIPAHRLQRGGGRRAQAPAARSARRPGF
jgi:alkanesulfonate monooxygenase